jgi:hypothetical protein
MYASVHDAVETFSGDVNTFNATPELLVGKQALEAEALLQWESLFASRLPWLTASIARYEHQEDAESRFTRGVDKLLPIIVHITDDASGLLRAGRTRPEFVAALAETRSRLIGFTPDFPALHQLADSLSVTALRVYDEAEADVMSNTSSNPPLPSGASSPGPAARPYRKFHVYSAGWDGDPETLGMRCWVCGVSQEFGADDDAIGLEELTAWAEAHRCPRMRVPDVATGPSLTPPADADLPGGGREFRVAGNLLQDGRYCVAELAESGLEVRLGGLERWQAYGIVAILHPPFEE